MLLGRVSVSNERPRIAQLDRKPEYPARPFITCLVSFVKPRLLKRLRLIEF